MAAGLSPISRRCFAVRRRRDFGASLSGHVSFTAYVEFHARRALATFARWLTHLAIAARPCSISTPAPMMLPARFPIICFTGNLFSAELSRPSRASSTALSSLFPARALFFRHVYNISCHDFLICRVLPFYYALMPQQAAPRHARECLLRL